MDSTKQQKTKPLSYAAIMDSLATSFMDRQDLYPAFHPFEDGYGGSSLDKNACRAVEVEPSDTPESSRSGFSEVSSGFSALSSGSSEVSSGFSEVSSGFSSLSSRFSEPSSELYEGVQLDINHNIFNEARQPFLGENDLESFNKSISWNDVSEPFDSPFSFDTSLYTMEDVYEWPTAQQYAAQLPPAPISNHQQVNMNLDSDQDPRSSTSLSALSFAGYQTILPKVYNTQDTPERFQTKMERVIDKKQGDTQPLNPLGVKLPSLIQPEIKKNHPKGSHCIARHQKCLDDKGKRPRPLGDDYGLPKKRAIDVYRALFVEKGLTSPQSLAPAILNATEFRHTPHHLNSDFFETNSGVLPLHQCEISPLRAGAQKESMSVQDLPGQERESVHRYLPKQDEGDKYDHCARDSDRQTNPQFLRDKNQSLAKFPTEGTHKRSPSISAENVAINLSLSIPFESSSSKCTTMSSFTDDDESDWGETEANGSVQDEMYFPGFSSFSQEESFSQEQAKDNLTRPVFSPIKQALVDSIMKEFWIIFNQENEVVQNNSPADLFVESAENRNRNAATNSAGGEESSRNGASNVSTGSMNTSQKFTSNILGRRSRDDEENQEQNNGEERGPKRPRMLSSPPQNSDDSTKFACPYRKRDPRKYCIKHWRSCALTPQESVARVKGHLYRHHRIFPCQRCKALFKDQVAVHLHLMQRDACERRDIEHSDGITTEIVEKLRSKKKVQKDQTEAERWKDIYKLLFPNEMIPSPYFEEVQEDIMLSPDSRELGDYEEYCRRELPRRVRAALEEIVHHDTQPIEESLRNQLMNIIRDCQDRVFSSYRSSSAAGLSVGTPSRNPVASDSSLAVSQESVAMVTSSPSITPVSSFGRITPPFFQPPPPQIHLRSGLEVSDLQDNTITKPANGSDPSDSGYDSNGLGASLGTLSSFNNTSDSFPLPSSVSHTVNTGPDSDDEQGTSDTANQVDINTTNDIVNSQATSTLEESWLDFNPQATEGNGWNSYMDDLEMEYGFSSGQVP